MVRMSKSSAAVQVRRSEVLALHAAGLTRAPEIAERLGVPGHAVYNDLAALWLTRSGPRPPRRKAEPLPPPSYRPDPACAEMLAEWRKRRREAARRKGGLA